MEIIKVEMDKGADIKDVAREVAEKVAEKVSKALEERMANDGNTNQSDEDNSAETDNLDREGMGKLAHTEEFQKFSNELASRINELINFVENNRQKYNCSIVVGVTAAYGKESNFGHSGGSGCRDSIRASLTRILEHEAIGVEAYKVVLSSLSGILK